MSLSANKARLSELTRDLLLRWADTRQGWTDARGAAFEQDYLRELKANVDEAVSSMDELEELLWKMRRECE